MSLDYYFVCTSSKCSGFAMLNRKNPKEFRVTKNHSIEYYKHPYYKI